MDEMQVETESTTVEVSVPVKITYCWNPEAIKQAMELKYVEINEAIEEIEALVATGKSFLGTKTEVEDSKISIYVSGAYPKRDVIIYMADAPRRWVHYVKSTMGISRFEWFRREKSLLWKVWVSTLIMLFLSILFLYAGIALGTYLSIILMAVAIADTLFVLANIKKVRWLWHYYRSR